MSRVTGKVKWWNDAKGFGFLTTESTSGDIFVHYTAITGDGFKTLATDQTVTFDLTNAPNGLQALNVIKFKIPHYP